MFLFATSSTLIPIGFKTSQALNLVGASKPNQVVSISVIPEINIWLSSRYADIEKGVSNSISLIVSLPTIVSSTLESKSLLGSTNSSIVNIASGKSVDCNHWLFMAWSLIILLLFKVEISAFIWRSFKYKHESAWSHSERVRVNPPIISRVVPSTISKPEFKNCFGAKYPTTLFSFSTINSTFSKDSSCTISRVVNVVELSSFVALGSIIVDSGFIVSSTTSFCAQKIKTKNKDI